MSFVIEAPALRSSLSRIQSAVSRGAEITVLKAVKIDASGDILTLTGTDMEIAISDKIAIPVTEHTSILVPFLELSEFAKRVSDSADITISIDADMALLQSGKRYKVTIPTLPLAEFPLLAPERDAQSFTVSRPLFGAALARVRFAVNQDATHITSGVHIHEHKGTLRVVGASGGCIGVTDAYVEDVKNVVPVTLPTKAIEAITKLIEGSQEKSLTMAVSPHRLVVTIGATELVSKIMDGEFISYDRLIPTEGSQPNVFRAARAPLREALGVVVAFSSGYNDEVIRLLLSEEEMVLEAVRKMTGSARAQMQTGDAEYSGAPINMAINSRFIAQAVAVNEGDCVLSFKDDSSPVLMTFPSVPNVRYVVARYVA